MKFLPSSNMFVLRMGQIPVFSARAPFFLEIAGQGKGMDVNGKTGAQQKQIDLWMFQGTFEDDFPLAPGGIWTRFFGG